MFAVKAGGEAAEVANAGKKWITSVAAGPQGAIAYATGKTAFVRFADDKTREFAHPRSVEGLAFSPKGMRQMRLFGFRRCNQFGGERGIDKANQHLDAPATALADLRPERHVERGADFIDLDAGFFALPLAGR